MVTAARVNHCLPSCLLLLNVEWEPEFPSIHNTRQLRKFTSAYFRARDDFMQTVATMMRGTVAVADLQGNVKVIAPEVIQ